MFYTSLYTLNSLKSAIEDKVKEIGNVPDSVVARATYKALKVYYKYEQRLMSDRWTETETIAIPETGFEVQTIGVSLLPVWETTTSYKTGDTVQESGTGYVCVGNHTSAVFLDDSAQWEKYYPLQSDDSIQMYVGEKQDEHNLIPRTGAGSTVLGWYEKADGKIYLTSGVATTVTVQYLKSPTLISTSSVDMTQTLKIVREAEDMFEEFVLSRFFRREGEEDREQSAEARFGEQLQELFANTEMRAVFL